MWEFDTTTGKWTMLLTEYAPSAAARGAGLTLALGVACAAMLWGGV